MNDDLNNVFNEQHWNLEAMKSKPLAIFYNKNCVNSRISKMGTKGLQFIFADFGDDDERDGSLIVIDSRVYVQDA